MTEAIERAAKQEPTLGLLYERFLVLESYVRGRGEDLLTPNAVLSLYSVTPYRLNQALLKGELKAYDKGCEARGGRESYKVRRADVIRVFDLPPLPIGDSEPEPSEGARAAEQAKTERTPKRAAARKR